MLSHEILSQRRPSRGGVFLAAPGTGYVPDRYAAPRHRRETDKRSATRQLPTRHPVNTPHPRHRRETDKPSATRQLPTRHPVNTPHPGIGSEYAKQVAGIPHANTAFNPGKNRGGSKSHRPGHRMQFPPVPIPRPIFRWARAPSPVRAHLPQAALPPGTRTSRAASR